MNKYTKNGGDIKMVDRNVNPRGVRRPRDGRGRGVGVPNGLRQGRNINPCPDDPRGGFGSGRGIGRGRNRRA
jgi:hypothetical protein